MGRGIMVEESEVGVCKRICDEGAASRRQGIFYTRVSGRVIWALKSPMTMLS